MKKILLISPPIEVPDIYSYYKTSFPNIKEAQIYAAPPNSGYQDMGLLKVGSYLKKQGNKVTLIDCRSENNGRKNSIQRKTIVDEREVGILGSRQGKMNIFLCGLPYGELKQRLSEIEKPDEIYISTGLTYHSNPVHEIIKICKSMLPTAKIIVGGLYATLCPDDLKGDVDKVIEGPYEDAREEWTDLSLLDYSPENACIKISYGCPNSCTYCAVSHLEGNKVNFRDINNLYDEILYKNKNYRIKKFILWGSNILFNFKENLGRLLDLIIETKINIEFEMPEGLQPNLVTEEIAKKLKQAGLIDVALPLEGVEDFDKKFNRPNKLKDFITAVETFKKVGYKSKQIYCFVIAGMPNQKIEDIIKTIRFIWKIGCIPDVFPYAPVPKSEDYKKFVPEDVKYTELDPCLWPFSNDKMKMEDLMDLLITSEKTLKEYFNIIKDKKGLLYKIFTEKELDYIIKNIQDEQNN